MERPINKTTWPDKKRENSVRDHARSASVERDALLARLPALQRVAFVMCEKNGLSDHAIAAHLHVEIEEARRLVREARLELRRLQLTNATGERTR